MNIRGCYYSPVILHSCPPAVNMYLKSHLANLVVFERECIAYFLQKEKEAKSNQIDEKLARIEER